MQEEPKWTAPKVRKTYIDFFVQKHKHLFVPSSSVVPYNDPTLLFANAGMNQFKPIFLGQVDPKSEQATWKRAANSQKCIRAGGKHNDLEAVGNDTYHHTFFEMLGNWSFGDYFKTEAISMAWELLTEIYGLDKSRLYATYFAGDKEDNLPEDEEAKNIWLKYLPAERVLPFSKKENFWEMGETGPCGPCSEIHYDRIGNRDAASLVNMDDPTVIEIWNLVFIQFNRESDGALRLLPAKHVDTGMGFERLLSILQNVKSNYDTDLFAPIFKKIQEVTRTPEPYGGKLGEEDTDFKDKAYRVIADHIRTLTFAITDGASPGPKGRDHILRNILRRAVRYGREVLKAREPFFHRIVPAVIDCLGEFYPELKKNPQQVMRIIRIEEENFNKTLTKGTRKFYKVISSLKEGEQISGQDAFILYDRYGFPLELTTTMGFEKKKLTVDEKEFDRLLVEAGKKSEVEKKEKYSIPLDAEAVAHLRSKGVPSTNDSWKYEENKEEEEEEKEEEEKEKEKKKKYVTKVVALVTATEVDEKVVVEHVDVSQDSKVGVILESTSFYAEGGGQVADTGRIVVEEGSIGEVHIIDVKVHAGYIVHIGTVKGRITVGSNVKLRVDYSRRQPIMANHTSTHMLNFALRETLGEGVDQKGSIVLPDKFRFDFSYTEPLNKQQLEKVDGIVGGLIKDDKKVYAKEISLKLAKQINGLRAVFGEIYPDPVRVVSVGVDVEELIKDPENQEWKKYSIELCGGTHLNSVGSAVAFALVGEEAVGSGVRRVTAVTGEEALRAIQVGDVFTQKITEFKNILSNRKQSEGEEDNQKDQEYLTQAVSLFRNELGEATMPQHIKVGLREELDKFDTEIRGMLRRIKGDLKQYIDQHVEKVNKEIDEKKDKKEPFVNFRVEVLLEVGGQGQMLTNAIKGISSKHPDLALLYISADTAAKKPSVKIVSHVPDELQKKGLLANQWALEAAKVCGGKGGGKPGTAQGAGPDVSKVAEVEKKAKEYAAEKLG